MNIGLELENLIIKESNKNFFKAIQNDLPALFTIARIFLWQSSFHHQSFKCYEQRVDINKSIEFVKASLKEINPDYYNKFNTLIDNAKEPNKKCLKFLKQSYDFPKDNGLGDDGNLYIYYYETIEDAYIIMENFINDLIQTDEVNLLNIYGDKTLSFVASLIMENYISNQDFFNTEFKNYKYNTLRICYESASYLLLISKLIEFYIKKISENKHFDDNILEEIKLSEDFSSIFYRILNDDIYIMARNLLKKETLNLEGFIKDIILILTAFPFYDELKNNPDKSKYSYLIYVLSNNNAALSYDKILRTKFLDENNNIKKTYLEILNHSLKDNI